MTSEELLERIKPPSRNMASNQPRDKDGQWSTTGGGGAASKSGTTPKTPASPGVVKPLEIAKPPDVSKLKYISDLPGSTGPKLMKDENGKKWVLKTGPGEAQLKNEIDADSAYRALGIDVANSYLLDGEGGKKVKVSEFIEGGDTLNKWKKGKSKEEVQDMYDKVSKGFAADAVLANWDSVGLNMDNILIKDGKPIRIDNGGALLYRAQGAPKGAAFGNVVNELTTLRDPKLNPTAAEVFGKLTNDQIYEQLDVMKLGKLGKSIKDPAVATLVSQRFMALMKATTPAPIAAVTAQYTQVSKPAPPPTVKVEIPGGVKLPDSHVIKASSVPLPPTSFIPTPPVPAKPSGVKPAKLTDKSPHEQLVASGEGLSVLLKKSGGDLFNKHDVYGIKHTNGSGISTDANGETFLNIRKGLSPEGRAKLMEITGVSKLKEVSEAVVKEGVKGFHEGKKMNPVAQAAIAAMPSPDSVSKGPVTSKYGNTDIVTTNKKGLKDIEAQVTEGALNEAKSPLPIKEGNKWASALSGDEAEAIEGWKASSYVFRQEILEIPKYGEPSSGTKALLSALEKAPQVGDAVVYRGMDHNIDLQAIVKQLEEGGPGSIYVDNAPHSMSINPTKAAGFGGSNGVLMKIYSKTGRHIQYGPGGYHNTGANHEMEVTGMAATKYRLISVESASSVKQKGVMAAGISKYVVLEEI